MSDHANKGAARNRLLTMSTVVRALVSTGTVVAVAVIAALVSTSAQAARPATGGMNNAYLTSVACYSPTGCLAVGEDDVTQSSNGAFGMKLSGATWSRVKIPLPKGVKNESLGSVACGSRSFCVAVGQAAAIKFGALQQVALVWNGRSWHISPPSEKKVQGSLEAVSCSSPRRCTAVGEADGPNGGLRMAVTQWNHGTVRRLTVPNAGRWPGSLTSVSCASTGTCVALGFVTLPGKKSSSDITATIHGQAVHVTLNHWPSGFQTMFVSCVKAWCAAAGGEGPKCFYLRAQWSNDAWSQLKCDAKAAGQHQSNGEVVGVDCWALHQCFAYGGVQYYCCGVIPTSSYDHPMVLALRQGHWKAVSSPRPNGGGIFGISCLSAHVCWAVGQTQPPSSSLRPLIMRWNGHKWSVVAT